MKIVMKSDAYGCEHFFDTDSLDEATACVGRLVKKVQDLDDGIERVVGILVNEKKEDEDEDIRWTDTLSA